MKPWQRLNGGSLQWIRIAERALRRTNIKPISNLIGRRNKLLLYELLRKPRCFIPITSTVDPGYKKLAYKKYPLIVNAYLGPDWQFHSFWNPYVRKFDYKKHQWRSPDVDYIRDPLYLVVWNWVICFLFCSRRKKRMRSSCSTTASRLPRLPTPAGTSAFVSNL